ncbi:hypothetical protein PIIN_00018 [Serendipita indica DSM 11827]|uniref:Uncharacterized protein n=1 Tax=Serendipita indica (strain DSM 11827) TaxID=1109443 RepID=G4T508_SERID|nr:hypothetical protein PIIN_00018 [Serendipita indica DSM 11827]
MSSTSATPSSTRSATPSPTETSELPRVDHDLNPIISFIIGTAIILVASIMNAGGLNLVKMDMIRTMELPRHQRRKDFLRPLWLIGMVLYIASQLIGSTLALEFLRAEYVAPLGSSSLVFNFLFARWLVGTPVTRMDIYGTIIVILGVVGIVAFGSINKGLNTHMNLDILIGLWSRVGWLCYLVLLGILPIFFLYFGASQLETILLDRMDIMGDPLMTPIPVTTSVSGSGGWRAFRGGPQPEVGFWEGIRVRWRNMTYWTRGWIERWSRDKSEKTLAWTLGICWACCGGALAGGTLVFAKASVKMVSGYLSHRNTGNQFGHPAAIFTFIFLAVTAVLQILCLNRGLRAYDSTLVVPVFYGVYTASGFLDSLVFNDEIDAYEPWTLFLIFASIVVLIGGVVLLTLKKPEKPKPKTPGASNHRFPGTSASKRGDEEDEISLTERGKDKAPGPSWHVGDETDSEDEDLRNSKSGAPIMSPESSQRRTLPYDGRIEARGLMQDGDDGDDFGGFTSADKRQGK